MRASGGRAAVELEFGPVISCFHPRREQHGRRTISMRLADAASGSPLPSLSTTSSLAGTGAGGAVGIAVSVRPRWIGVCNPWSYAHIRWRPPW